MAEERTPHAPGTPFVFAEGDYKPKNIFITGGCGFICSHVVLRLVKDFPHYNIINLDILDYCASLHNLDEIRGAPNYKFVKGDICNQELVTFLLQENKVDTILHFAAQSHVDASFGNSLEFTRTNVQGTHTLLECMRNYNDDPSHPHAIKRFVHVSTDEVYGEVPIGLPSATETATLDPTNPYSCSKAAAEFICKAYVRSYGLPIILTRGNNVYGPHQFPEKVIPKFIYRLEQGLKCCLHGGGSAERTFIYVEDVARAFVTIMHRGTPANPEASPPITGVYNIGTEFEMSMVTLAKKLIRIVKKVPEGSEDEWLEVVEDRKFNDCRYSIDSSRLHDLGWRQDVDFEEGLQRTVDWYLTPGRAQNHWKDIQFALAPHPLAMHQK